MNITLREVYQTSADGDRFWKLKECYIRGSTVSSTPFSCFFGSIVHLIATALGACVVMVVCVPKKKDKILARTGYPPRRGQGRTSAGTRSRAERERCRSWSWQRYALAFFSQVPIYLIVIHRGVLSIHPSPPCPMIRSHRTAFSQHHAAQADAGYQ